MAVSSRRYDEALQYDTAKQILGVCIAQPIPFWLGRFVPPGNKGQSFPASSGGSVHGQFFKSGFLHGHKIAISVCLVSVSLLVSISNDLRSPAVIPGKYAAQGAPHRGILRKPQEHFQKNTQVSSVLAFAKLLQEADVNCMFATTVAVAKRPETPVLHGKDTKQCSIQLPTR